MEAVKNIKLKMPEDIDNVELNMMRYDIAESRIAFLKLVKNEAIKYYNSENEEKDDLS